MADGGKLSTSKPMGQSRHGSAQLAGAQGGGAIGKEAARWAVSHSTWRAIEAVCLLAVDGAGPATQPLRGVRTAGMGRPMP